MNASRRGFIGGLVAAFAAPVVVPAANLVRRILPSRRVLTISEITRESMRMFINSNSFINNIDQQFASENYRIGSALKIRIPTAG